MARRVTGPSSSGATRTTRLLRDAFRPAIYLTLDFWNSREAYEAFMAVHKDMYKTLDAAGEELTSKERRIGWYELAGP
jgi:hypothetical protein